MFLNIIHKSEVSYLCCYQKRSYTESIKASLVLTICAQNFSMSKVVSRFRKLEQSKILDSIIVIGK